MHVFRCQISPTITNRKIQSVRTLRKSRAAPVELSPKQVENGPNLVETGVYFSTSECHETSRQVCPKSLKLTNQPIKRKNNVHVNMHTHVQAGTEMLAPTRVSTEKSTKCSFPLTWGAGDDVAPTDGCPLAAPPPTDAETGGA